MLKDGTTQIGNEAKIETKTELQHNDDYNIVFGNMSNFENILVSFFQIRSHS